MTPPDLPDLLRIVGGLCGSVVSMLWLRETLWMRRLIVFVGGWSFSVGSQVQVSKWTHLEPGFFLGFVLGACAMSFFAKAIESWQAVNFGKIVNDALRKRFGLPLSAPAPLPDPPP